ncbi:hypothetical protein NYF23_10430 [SAR92 clade bacterium H455]|uniref:Transcriptional regulator n=1 Tax=SAR92 clade bacterium H455 TaxID=2974818 RepID=A0ABY5TPB0_9GAMM|nr:hypothetical protein NYF23_10430 [SAR92 clade bacterium H455]
MQRKDLESNNRVVISAAELEKQFDAGLGNFKVLLNKVDSTEREELFELLETAIKEIAAAKK